MALTTIIFDLDGTLVDSLPDIAAAANAELEHQGLVGHPVDAYRRLIGGGMNALVEKLVPHLGAGQKKIFYQSLLQRYGQQLYLNSHLYPGIATLIRQLRDDGLRLAIYTNKQHDLAVRMASRFFDLENFALVLGHREGAAPKPDAATTRQLLKELSVEPDRCLLVGDTPVDMATAYAVGMPCLGVAWGYQPQTALVAAGAWGIAQTPDDIRAWVRENAAAQPLNTAYGTP